MAKYRVRVAQHRILEVTVEAKDGADALKRGEAHVRECCWDSGAILGDPPFRAIAVAAAILDEQIPGTSPGTWDAGGSSDPSHSPSTDGRSSERPIAPRPFPSRQAGARHLPTQIARRFGLAALAASLIALHAPQARADIQGGADEFIYAGQNFTTFQGGDACPHVCALSGKVILSTDLAKYLNPESGYANEILVTQSSPDLGVYLKDGVKGPPAIPPSFTFEAFLNPGHTAIDFSQGWSLSAAWNPSPDGYENRFLSVYSGSGVAFGATTDETLTLDASGVLTAEAFNTNAQGSWVDPVVSVPEASTWMMLLVGFFGMAPWVLRDPVVARARAIIRGRR